MSEKIFQVHVDANEFTRCIHNRMPVLLGRYDYNTWLTGKAGVELLRPAPNDLLRMQLVSKRVNVSGRGDDDPGLIEPVEDEAIATSYNADRLSS